MNTESFDSRFKGLDQWDNETILTALLAAQERAVAALHPVLPALADAAQEAAQRLRRGSGRLIYAGAGTPARLGVLDGTELTPTFGWPAQRLGFVIAGGAAALLQAVEGAEDDTAQATRDLAAQSPGPEDICIAVSASGRTPYTLAVCRGARAAGALTIGIASNQAAPLLSAADHGIFIDSGPEPVSGSTRMNAGTVQKIALNMLSTLIMIRMGRVYDGMMVDVALNNEKLRLRARRMLEEITGCRPDAATEALADAGGHVKLAVLLLNGLTVVTAKKLLAHHHGDLRAALTSLEE